MVASEDMYPYTGIAEISPRSLFDDCGPRIADPPGSGLLQPLVVCGNKNVLNEIIFQRMLFMERGMYFLLEQERSNERSSMKRTRT